MRRRTPTLLILLAVGAVCFLLWDAVLAPALDDAGEEAAGSILDDPAYLADSVEPVSAGPTLAASGRAPRSPDGGPGGLGAAQGSEGPGGSTTSNASVPFVGTVLGHDGRPAAGVKILMKGPGGAVVEVETGADGDFKHAVRPGRYALMFDGGESGGLVLQSWMLDGAPKEELEFALKEPAAIAVKVERGKDKVAEVAVLVTSRELGDLVQHEGSTDFDGMALFEGLPPGRYDVAAQVPDGPAVTHMLYAKPSQTNPVNVRVPEGVQFKGVVRAGKDGPGIPAASITLKTAAYRSQGLFETVFETQTDGTFDLLVPRGTARAFLVEAEGHASWPTPAQLRGVLRSLRGLRKRGPVTRNVTLESGAVLTGLVQNEDKQPLPGIRLRFVMRKGPTADAVTQSDGTYAVESLMPGGYDLQIETPSWFPVRGQALRVGIPGGAVPKPTAFDITLVGARRLEGVVVDAAGQGVGGARVWIIGGGRVVRSARDAGRVLEVFTNTNGSWIISDIPPDKHVVVRAAMGQLEADPVPARWDKPPPLPIRMKLKGTGTVRGRVVDIDSRVPVAGAQVRVRPDPFDGRTGRTVVTNPAGEFLLESMLPGAWTFTPSKRGYLVAGPDTANVVREAEVDVELRLDPGLVFAGVVVDAAGAPLRWTRVTVRGIPDGKEKPVSRGVTTNGKGVFRLTGFEHGMYTLTAYRRGLRTVRLKDRRSSERSLRIVLVSAARR